MKFISLLTDFGVRDGYVGVMKGVIYGIAPDVQIADITHTISPQNVMEGAIALGRAAPYFPDGTVHIAVVDPGVGTTRHSIAARIGRFSYVGPDNGLFTVVLQRAERRHEPIKLVRLDRRGYWLPEISNVFHGRDIFAPVGAHLANGVPLEELGTLVEDIIRLDMPEVETTENGVRGQVISVDNFGNLATNIHRADLPANIERLVVSVAGTKIHGLVRTFGSRPTGELIALYGTANDLLVSVANGSAAERLGASVGAVVDVQVETA